LKSTPTLQTHKDESTAIYQRHDEQLKELDARLSGLNTNCWQRVAKLTKGKYWLRMNMLIINILIVVNLIVLFLMYRSMDAQVESQESQTNLC
jgi:hypothetical protein